MNISIIEPTADRIGGRFVKRPYAFSWVHACSTTQQLKLYFSFMEMYTNLKARKGCISMAGKEIYLSPEEQEYLHGI
ncbi:MAG: hypothetical protein IJ112_02095, partial [Oscillospiraceae bacterium]|nr:hypothetical protein [Oscillospiraceae bacterium]